MCAWVRVDACVFVFVLHACAPCACVACLPADSVLENRLGLPGLGGRPRSAAGAAASLGPRVRSSGPTAHFRLTLSIQPDCSRSLPPSLPVCVALSLSPPTPFPALSLPLCFFSSLPLSLTRTGRYYSRNGCVLIVLAPSVYRPTRRAWASVGVGGGANSRPITPGCAP